MKISLIPNAKHKNLKLRKCGNWSFYDTTLENGELVRNVYHYKTHMVTINFQDSLATLMSFGRNSKSDQHGVNQIFASCQRLGIGGDAEKRYSRHSGKIQLIG